MSFCEDQKSNLQTDKKQVKDGIFIYPKEVDELFEKYFSFCQDTRNGKMGKTAQFWMQYIDFIQLYHDFICSIRNGNLELFISSLPRLTNIFFALNNPNGW